MSDSASFAQGRLAQRSFSYFNFFAFPSINDLIYVPMFMVRATRTGILPGHKRGGLSWLSPLASQSATSLQA